MHTATPSMVGGCSAQIVGALVNRDQLDLAAACMGALLDGQQPWAAATAEAYMVSAGHAKASLQAWLPESPVSEF